MALESFVSLNLAATGHPKSLGCSPVGFDFRHFFLPFFYRLRFIKLSIWGSEASPCFVPLILVQCRPWQCLGSDQPRLGASACPARYGCFLAHDRTLRP